MAALFLIIVFVKITLTVCGDSSDSSRLPNYIEPESYRVFLVPNLQDDFDFYGNVTVDIRSKVDFKCFTLNVKDLEIKSVRINSWRNGNNYETSYALNNDQETLRLCTSTTLLAGYLYTAKIEFSGKLNDQFRGIYKIPYEYKGKRKWAVATQFTPTYARMGFPCFDEPKYTADMEISIARNDFQNCIGTFPLVHTSNPDPTINGRRWAKFKAQKSYPLYMLSFAMFEFESVHNRGKISVYHYKQIPYTDASYTLAKYNRIIDEIANYVSVYVPEIESDLIIVPDGNELTKMSGFDLYQETDLLYDLKIDGEQRKEDILKALTHKVFHFWIGTKVFVEWWNDTWLSESLARLLEYYVTAKIEPEWSMERKIPVEIFQTALFQDEIEYHHAVAAPTASPGQIEHQKFNTFAINKGAAILRMLETMVKTKRFQQALRYTITDYANKKTISSDDLWTNIQNQSPTLPPGETIRSIMDKWMNNIGYPIVNVETEQNGDVSLTLETYKSPRSLETIPDQEWTLMIRCDKYAYENTVDMTETWCSSKQKTTLRYQMKNNERIICNSMQTGYFRVNYTRDDWARLSEILQNRHEVIDVENRAMLLDDAFALATDGNLDLKFAFRLGTYLDKEADMIPWIASMKHFQYLLKQYAGTDAYEYIKHYILQRVGNQYERLGFHPTSSDSHLVQTGRPMISSMACSLGLQSCLQNAIQEYNRSIDDLTRISPYMRYVVYCTTVRTSRDKKPIWDKLWDLYVNSESKNEKETILRALACSDDEELFQKLLSRTVRPTSYILYKYEEEIIFKSTAESCTGIGAALKLISEMLKNIRNLTSQTIESLITFMNRLLPKVHTEEHWIEITYIRAEIKNLDRNKYADVIKAFESSTQKASKNRNSSSKNVENIKTAIRSVTGYDPPTTIASTTQTSTTQTSSTTPTPSSTCTSAGSSSSCGVILLSILLLIIHIL